MVIIGGNPSIQISGLTSSFRFEEYSSMSLEALDEYVLAYSEAYYKDPGEQAPMGFMASGGGFHHLNSSQ